MGGATKSRTARTRGAAANIVQGGGGSGASSTAKLRKMSAMSTDERADLLKSAFAYKLPPGIYDQGVTQRLVLAQGLNELPETVSDAAFDALAAKSGGKVIYRTLKTVNSNLTGKDLGENLLYGINNSLGTGIYGEGHYHAEKLGESLSYGDGRAGQATVRGILHKSAKVIEYNELVDMYNDEKKSSKKFKKVCEQIEQQSLKIKSGDYSHDTDIYSAYALTKGYDAIRVVTGIADGDYYVPITRDKITYSSYVQETAGKYGDKW